MRFLKIGDDGQELPFEAADWPVVAEPARRLMWTAKEVKVKNYAGCDKAVAAMNDARIGGFTDWRLPTIQELLTLVDYGRHHPAIDTNFFDYSSDWYWTSTPAAGSPADYAWVVYFDGGVSDWGSHGGGGFVRAVRATTHETSAERAVPGVLGAEVK